MRALLWGLVPALLGACDDPPALPGADVVGNDTVTPTCTVEATLSSLKANYFATSCAFSACHDKRSAEGDLDLSASDLHAQLVGVPAVQEAAFAAGKLRVVAGNPDASFMVQKVEGTMAIDEGTWMPDGTDEVVDPDCRVKRLKEWIAAGALDN
ncbi:MAG: hypothetical protein U1F43_16625 [Myxococcota bacterium]